MWNQKSEKNISVLEGSEHISGSDRGTASHPSIQDKKVFESSGQDSGFLSGPQNLYSSEDIDTHLDDLPDIEKFRDSGAIDEDDEDSHTKDTKQTSMILDSGVDVGLSEWFCGLNLKNASQPLNNLGGCRQTVLEEPKYPKISKLLQTTPLWEICYFQDEDGDT